MSSGFFAPNGEPGCNRTNSVQPKLIVGTQSAGCTREGNCDAPMVTPKRDASLMAVSSKFAPTRLAPFRLARKRLARQRHSGPATSSLLQRPAEAHSMCSLCGVFAYLRKLNAWVISRERHFLTNPACSMTALVRLRHRVSSLEASQLTRRSSNALLRSALSNGLPLNQLSKGRIFEQLPLVSP